LPKKLHPFLEVDDQTLLDEERKAEAIFFFDGVMGT
jgi:hypothetical protein